MSLATLVKTFGMELSGGRITLKLMLCRSDPIRVIVLARELVMPIFLLCSAPFFFSR